MATKVVVAALGALVAVTSATAATAQTDAAPPTAAAPGDIIVTARKRQESILKVPVVETALTQTQLERFQISGLTDVAGRVPGLVIGQGVLSIGAQVSIRGVGTSSLDAGIDQSVALNIDGLPLSQGLAYRVGTFDLAQAEVLKGPQALFFGKSSPGGVISLRTADPGNQLEVIARGSYEFATDQKRGDLILSGPLGDSLGVRLAGSYSRDNGYFHNIAVADPRFGGLTPSHRDYDTRNLILRGTALWKPVASFSARLKLNYARDRVDGSGGEGQWYSCPDGVGRNPINGIPFLAPPEDCRLDRKTSIVWMNPANFPGISNGGQPFTRQRQAFGTLELNYLPTDTLTLTSVTGYYDVRQSSLINGVMATTAGPTIAAENRFSRHDFSEELRLNSGFSGPLNFTAGGFYQDGRVRNLILVDGNSAYRLPALLVSAQHAMRIRSGSLFGQLRYRIAPAFEVAAGVRWTDETRRDDVFNNLTNAFYAQSVPKISSSNFSPELTLTYTPRDDLTVFGSLKQAYKSGSFNITATPTNGGSNAFNDEKVQGGEAGLKGRLLDRRLSYTLAGYYYHYTGLQVGASEPTGAGGIPIVRTLNAGASNVYGVDLDVSYRPAGIDGLSLRAAANWNHARLTRLLDAPCWGGQTVAEGCNRQLNPATGAYTAQDLSGGRLVRAPAWQLAAGFDYDLALSNGWTLTLSSDSRYSSRYLVDLLQRSDMYQRAYAQVDATVALRDRNSGWEVALIGNNLTDKLTTGNCSQLNGEAGQILGGENTGTNRPRGPAGVDELSCQINRGRQVFVRLTIRPDRLLH